MRKNVRRLPARLVAAAAAAAVAGGLTAIAQQRSGVEPVPRTPYAAPRTPWGHPDLQGTYSNDDETGTPMERPAAFEGRTHDSLTPAELKRIVDERNQRFVEGVSGDEFAGGLRPPTHLIFDTFDRRNRRAWLVVDPPDGKIPPLTDAAQRRPRPAGGVSTNANPLGPFNSWLDMGLYDRCITRGIPASMMPAGYGSRYEIVQSPDSVAIRYEMVHETRVIPFDRRPVVSPSIRQYLGDARAWWEGETLVVETTNFTDKTRFRGSTDKLKVTERFSRLTDNSLMYRFTVEDPDTWATSWTGEYTWPATDELMYEYACHEANYALGNILRGARQRERDAKSGSGR